MSRSNAAAAAAAAVAAAGEHSDGAEQHGRLHRAEASGCHHRCHHLLVHRLLVLLFPARSDVIHHGL